MVGENIDESILLDIYHCLLTNYGPQHWWPAETPFEVIVGAILTQSAAWSNVEKAITNLKTAAALNPNALRQLSSTELGQLIHPCGYYNAKALKLKSFVHWLGERYDDDLEKLFVLDIPQLRRELLSINGIGQETADSIILYAALKPVFVIDAYTWRIARRLKLSPDASSYGDLQTFFTENLPREEKLFSEYHALIVHHGKKVCRKHSLCQHCCLTHLCPSQLDTTST